MAQNISIRITGEQLVKYDQTIDMPLKEWERIKKLPASVLEHELGDWLDLKDVKDAETFDNFELWAVDKDSNKEKVPRDEYTG